MCHEVLDHLILFWRPIWQLADTKGKNASTPFCCNGALIYTWFPLTNIIACISKVCAALQFWNKELATNCLHRISNRITLHNKRLAWLLFLIRIFLIVVLNLELQRGTLYLSLSFHIFDMLVECNVWARLWADQACALSFGFQETLRFTADVEEIKELITVWHISLLDQILNLLKKLIILFFAFED